MQECSGPIWEMKSSAGWNKKKPIQQLYIEQFNIRPARKAKTFEIGRILK